MDVLIDKKSRKNTKKANKEAMRKFKKATEGLSDNHLMYCKILLKILAAMRSAKLL